jgi:hypothetical protein
MSLTHQLSPLAPAHQNPETLKNGEEEKPNQTIKTSRSDATLEPKTQKAQNIQEQKLDILSMDGKRKLPKTSDLQPKNKKGTFASKWS